MIGETPVTRPSRPRVTSPYGLVLPWLPQPVRARHCNGGFTLLEVILAIGLAIGLLGALFSFCNYAMTCRGLVVQKIEFVNAERNVMGHITDELRSAMVYPFLSQGMTSDGNSMAFISSTLPSLSVWVVPTASQDPAPPEQDLQMLTYQLRIDDDTGDVLGLERVCQKVIATEVASAGAETLLLSDKIKYLKFRFYDGQVWRDAWRDTGQQADNDMPAALLPTAVEVVMGPQVAPPNMTADDYMKAYPTYRRVIFVPLGGDASKGVTTLGAGADPNSSTGATSGGDANSSTGTTGSGSRRTGGSGGGNSTGTGSGL